MKISNHPPLIPYHKSLLLPKTAPRSSPTINVKIAEPIIAHTMGNRLPPTVTAKISGRLNLAASHIPIYAPMNPTTIETRQPPRSQPAKDCPMPPQMAAIMSRISNCVRSKGCVFQYRICCNLSATVAPHYPQS